MTADERAAKELTQDVFVRVWEKLDSFRGDSAMGTWIHRIAVNTVLMSRRSELRRGEEELDESVGDQRSAMSEKLDLEAAIASLPPMARQVLVLHDIEGYEHAEIGKLLGI